MGTPFKDVCDMALATIQDYKLDKLLTLSQEAYYVVLETYLLKGKTKFTKCLQSLEVDKVNKVFLSDLTDQEIVILSDFLTIQWFRREIQNVLAFNSKLKNREFDRFSEAQNLKEKVSYLIIMEEKVSQDVTDYQIATPDSWQENFKL